MITWIHFEEGDRVRLSASMMMRWWALIPACTEPWLRSIKAVADRDQNRSVRIRLREEDGESDACYLSPLLSLMLSPYLPLYHKLSLSPFYLSVALCLWVLQCSAESQWESWQLVDRFSSPPYSYRKTIKNNNSHHHHATGSVSPAISTTVIALRDAPPQDVLIMLACCAAVVMTRMPGWWFQSRLLTHFSGHFLQK